VVYRGLIVESQTTALSLVLKWSKTTIVQLDTRGFRPFIFNEALEKIEKMTKGKLLKSAFLVAAMILLSRVLGLWRDIVSAKIFGLGWAWDAFLYAFMVPNFFRRVVGEGALASAFIPVYNDIRAKQGEQEAFRYANLVYSFMGVALLVFVLVVELGLGACLKWGLFPERIRLAISLLQIMFPHVWFLCAYAIGMGILNSHGRFFTPMVGPVLMNGLWIAIMLWIFPFVKSGPIAQLNVLAWGMMFVGFLHWIIEWPDLAKIGFHFKWTWPWRLSKSPEQKLTPGYQGLLRSWKLFTPVLFSFAAVQVNMLVDTAFAYWVGPGANSSLWYGNRVMQLPLSMFAVAMGSALLPMLSDQVAQGKKEEAKQTLAFSLSVVYMVVLPASAGLIALAPDIMRMLFERGQFDAESTIRTAAVLSAYSWGLFAYSGQKMMIAGYYAVHDSKTPMWAGVFSLLLNAGLNFILMHRFREAGLAMATSISAIFQFAILMFLYPKHVGSFPFKESAMSFIKTLVASIVMAIAAKIVLTQWMHAMPPTSTTLYAIEVLGTIVIAVVIYVIVALLLQGKEAKQVFDYIRRNKNKSGPAMMS